MRSGWTFAALFLRSLLFNMLFYLNVIARMMLALPTLLLPRRVIWAMAKAWARSNLWLLRVICDIKVEFSGTEKIPPGPLIVACKHQSAWDTFALLPMFHDPTFILKRELMWLPLFGWLAWKADVIAVDRRAGARALRAMLAKARREIRRGRQLIIFPEGTRRPPGATPQYKPGIAQLYAEVGAPCLPVALNSGLYWGRRSFLRLPGTVRVEFLDPIPPGLDKKVFFARLREEIETASARLVALGEQELSAKFA